VGERSEQGNQGNQREIGGEASISPGVKDMRPRRARSSVRPFLRIDSNYPAAQAAAIPPVPMTGAGMHLLINANLDYRIVSK
jgi:hypothetical protein